MGKSLRVIAVMADARLRVVISVVGALWKRARSTVLIRPDAAAPFPPQHGFD